MKGCRILVIEDDPAIRSLLRQSLAPLGLAIHEETDGISGEARARDYLPELILLDLGLPGKSGLEVLRALRGWFKGSIVVITAWSDEDAKLQAFELGADDYIAKPFSPRELVARARVGLRRATAGGTAESGGAPETLSVARLRIELKEHRATVEGGSALTLTQTEYKFLSLLALEPGRLVTQGSLLSAIWGPNHADDTHYLRILVSRLRKKLDAQATGVRIITEPGLGYRIQGEDPA